MPYIITTEQTCDECHGQGRHHPNRAHMSHEVTDCPECGTSGMVVVSRRAVAALEDARDTILVAFKAADPRADRAAFDGVTLSESGATVPLPGGTVIEVERVSHAQLGIRAWASMRPAEVINAYNVAQAVR